MLWRNHDAILHHMDFHRHTINKTRIRQPLPVKGQVISVHTGIKLTTGWTVLRRFSSRMLRSSISPLTMEATGIFFVHRLSDFIITLIYCILCLGNSPLWHRILLSHNQLLFSCLWLAVYRCVNTFIPRTYLFTFITYYSQPMPLKFPVPIIPLCIKTQRCIKGNV